MSITSKINKDWKKFLKSEFSTPYFKDLEKKVKNEQKSNTIYPPVNQIFAALNFTSFENVKVVILGQDPYHGPNQANGLAFSVSKGIKLPPSLKNIFKELKSDLNIEIPEHGDLTSWALQGVLLLNSVLTVRQGSPGSHQKLGWQQFTDNVISKLSNEKTKLIFLLWGNYAISKKALIDIKKHYVLTAPHPSPFSAYSGFFGCKHFSKVNEKLKKQKQEPIQW